MLKFGCGFLFCLILMGAGNGCASIRVTDPYQTATEQFLESEATRQAIQRLSADPLRDRKVFMDTTYVLWTFKETPTTNLYLVAELRAQLLMNGVRLVDKKEDAEIIMEVRTGGIGVDRTDFLLGIPGITLTTGGIADVPLQTPEVAILKSTKQHGFASIAYTAYWRDTGELVASSGPFVGRTVRDDYWYFGFGPRTVGNIAPAQNAPPDQNTGKSKQ